MKDVKNRQATEKNSMTGNVQIAVKALSWSHATVVHVYVCLSGCQFLWDSWLCGEVVSSILRAITLNVYFWNLHDSPCLRTCLGPVQAGAEWDSCAAPEVAPDGQEAEVWVG